MPFQEYKCTDCGNDFVKLVNSSDDKVFCTRCFGENLSKLLPQKKSRHKAGAGNCPCATCQSLSEN